MDSIDVRNLIILETKNIGFPIVDVLKKCPLLQTLTAGALLGNNVPLSNCFFHAHLTTLNISRLDEKFPKDAWQSVRLPNLTHLDVVAHATSTEHIGKFTSTYAPIKHTLDALLDMLICSGCSLQKVSIQEWQGRTALGDGLLQAFLADLPVSPTGVRFLNQVPWTQRSFSGRGTTTTGSSFLSFFLPW